MHSIKHLKTLLLFAFTISDVTATVLEDGEFEWQEGLAYIPPLTELPEVIKSLPEIPKELADLDKAERAELIQFVQDKFDIENDAVEKLIERTFQFLVDTYGSVLELKDLIADLPRKEAPKA